uniref:Uncharacterized protein n=1 Tax=Odontella aurita TaxID=265563 RepID=A0A7S4I306_9STRA
MRNVKGGAPRPAVGADEGARGSSPKSCAGGGRKRIGIVGSGTVGRVQRARTSIRAPLIRAPRSAPVCPFSAIFKLSRTNTQSEGININTSSSRSQHNSTIFEHQPLTEFVCLLR